MYLNYIFILETKTKTLIKKIIFCSVCMLSECDPMPHTDKPNK